MKICPNCGFVEREYWRQNRWRTNVEFSPISEFEANYPDLMRLLKEGHPTALDKYSAYQLGGKPHRVVERVLRSEYESFGSSIFHQPMEHIDHKRSLNKKLFEEKVI